MKYMVEGRFSEKGKQQAFRKTIDADSESRALELVLSRIGSGHQVKRKDILVDHIEQSEAKK